MWAEQPPSVMNVLRESHRHLLFRLATPMESVQRDLRRAVGSESPARPDSSRDRIPLSVKTTGSSAMTAKQRERQVGAGVKCLIRQRICANKSRVTATSAICKTRLRA